VIKSDAGGERWTIGLFEEVGFADRNRAERNDPEGVKPQRGAEVRREFAGNGSVGRQRVESVDTDQPHVSVGWAEEFKGRTGRLRIRWNADAVDREC
jgi:hypothetical protein